MMDELDRRIVNALQGDFPLCERPFAVAGARLGVVRQGAALRMAYALEERCYRAAWLVTAQSREIAASVETRFPGVPTFHLPNGVDTDVFTPEKRSAGIRRWLGARSDDDCIAVYAGLHGIAQGLDQVLRAADRARVALGELHPRVSRNRRRIDRRRLHLRAQSTAREGALRDGQEPRAARRRARRRE